MSVHKAAFVTTTLSPRFYGRRKGKALRPNRARVLAQLLPSLTISLPPDLAGWRDVWLEIGFGSGEHLAWQAANHPDVLMIGCEPFLNGVACLLDDVEKQALRNIRIHPDDARPLLAELPDACLGRVFLLFNDPWPKKRHHDRRFIQPETLDQLARVMKPGSELRLASDHPGLVRWTLHHARRHPAFRWHVPHCHAWRTRPADWPPTRYELKALHGRPVFLTFLRKA